MSRPLTNIEFFSHDGAVWYKEDGKVQKLTERDFEMVDALTEMISTFYPKAYKALSEEYAGCALNKMYYRYRIVARFAKCNFGNLDEVPDIGIDGSINFECVPCPLRGECKHEGIVCRPEFDHKLSGAELPVMKLWYMGYTEEEIGGRLCLSPYTVHNHVRNAYRRLGVHSRGEFIRYADKNNLF